MRVKPTEDTPIEQADEYICRTQGLMFIVALQIGLDEHIQIIKERRAQGHLVPEMLTGFDLKPIDGVKVTGQWDPQTLHALFELWRTGTVFDGQPNHDTEAILRQIRLDADLHQISARTLVAAIRAMGRLHPEWVPGAITRGSRVQYLLPAGTVTPLYGGRAPLPIPAPRATAYPWIDVQPIEATSPGGCAVGGVMSFGRQIPGRPMASSPLQFNQDNMSPAEVAGAG